MEGTDTGTFGRDLTDSAREALAIAEGKAVGRVMEAEGGYVRAIRQRLGLSQAAFAEAFGLAAATVREWEQRRRVPDRTARVLLKVIEQDADAVRRALGRP